MQTEYYSCYALSKVILDVTVPREVRTPVPEEVNSLLILHNILTLIILPT
jgi:uncharacterized protein (UPF0147 family)